VTQNDKLGFPDVVKFSERGGRLCPCKEPYSFFAWLSWELAAVESPEKQRCLRVI
jgi:hypothetical protein